MTKRILLAVAIMLGMSVLAHAQGLSDRQTYNLWPGQAPGQQGDEPSDVPVVQAFVPEPGKATGASFVVCPGGGYAHLAAHEGPKVGEWFAKSGVTAFVLRYRLGPKYHHPVEMEDAQRAMRFVRSHAKDWKLDPDRIGIMGFSAGGHLASTIATHFDEGKADAADAIERASSRPDLQVLVYPVVTMGPGGHGGSKKNLLGDKPTPELVNLLSNEKHVTDKTPQAFVVHSAKDPVVPVSNSDNYVEALKKAGVKVEYVRLAEGGHGFGLTDAWAPKCIEWLKEKGWAKGD